MCMHGAIFDKIIIIIGNQFYVLACIWRFCKLANIDILAMKYFKTILFLLFVQYFTAYSFEGLNIRSARLLWQDVQVHTFSTSLTEYFRFRAYEVIQKSNKIYKK